MVTRREEWRGGIDWEFGIDNTHCYIYLLFFNINFLCRVHHEKRWTGRNTNWNRLPGEISITSYMQMTLLLWQKVKKKTKESLDESERGE